MPDGAPVVFSAHGVPKAVPEKAQARGLNYLDATCPLVSKVHRQAERLIERGRHILFVGHAGHPEVIGTFGQVPEGMMTLVETAARRRDDHARRSRQRSPSSPRPRFRSTTPPRSSPSCAAASPSIPVPRSEDICYATSNRQAAVKAIAARCDALLVIGSPNSSNSLRLVEVAEREGTKARLVGRGDGPRFRLARRRPHARHHRRRLGARIAGARSGRRARERFDVTEEPVEGVEERMVFKLPAGLEAA